jgi:hypothetical protein
MKGNFDHKGPVQASETAADDAHTRIVAYPSPSPALKAIDRPKSPDGGVFEQDESSRDHQVESPSTLSYFLTMMPWEYFFSPGEFAGTKTIFFSSSDSKRRKEQVETVSTDTSYRETAKDDALAKTEHQDKTAGDKEGKYACVEDEIHKRLMLDHEEQCHVVPTKIPLVLQLSTWDCGIACIQMVHRWLCQSIIVPANATSWGRDDMLKAVGTRSVWSIDLVILFQRILDSSPALKEKTTYVFCSKTLEVDTSHEELGYYKKAFTEDQVRVNRLFNHAKQNKLPLLRTQRFELEQVVKLISRSDCIAVVLLDNSILRGVTRPFTGHYVVISGISYHRLHLQEAAKRERGINQQGSTTSSNPYCLVIKNPASPLETEYITPAHFERAWRSSGTDDDILFIAKLPEKSLYS